MPEVSLQRSGVVVLIGQREAAGVAQHVRMSRKTSASPQRRPVPTMRAKPAVVNSDPRSLLNTNSNLGSCSRCNLRRARIFIADNQMGNRRALLALRTCRTAWVKLI